MNGENAYKIMANIYAEVRSNTREIETVLIGYQCANLINIRDFNLLRNFTLTEAEDLIEKNLLTDDNTRWCVYIRYVTYNKDSNVLKFDERYGVKWVEEFIKRAPYFSKNGFKMEDGIKDDVIEEIQRAIERYGKDIHCN